MDKLHGRSPFGLTHACGVLSICFVLGGCGASNLASMASVTTPDATDSVRTTDFSPRYPVANEGNPGNSGRPSRTRDRDSGESSQPFLFPGSDVQPERSRERDPELRTASLQPAAFMKGEGVEMNFEGADVQTVAKTLLGDILHLNFVVDPRVQGNVTLASAGPIARKDVLPAFESVLKMSNAAIVRQGDLVKVVPMPEAGAGSISVGAGEPGFGVSLVPLRYTSASTVAKTAESFLSRAGAIRVVQSRNLLLVQGTTAERQAALDVVATFDVEWLQNQSVGVYPLKSTAPETMIAELERVFETADGGLGQGVIRFQPISRMNAVMVVTKNPKLLAQTTQWVKRLDRSDSTGTTLRTFKLKNGKATEVAKILNDIFGAKGGSGDSATKQLAPGVDGAQARMDALDRGSSSGNGSNAGGLTNASTNSDSRSAGTIAAAFETFTTRKTNSDADASGTSAGPMPRGTFQNLRITADTSNNSIVVYSNQEDYRVVERALRDIDRPLMQVAIDATVAEVTLTDDLQFGVQAFLTSKDVGLGKNNGAVSLLSAGQDAAQGALLQKVAPGLNLLLGSASQPRVILNALSTITDVKVLSSPSIVALDNQPALLQVGDEVPITTSSAAVLTGANTPIVNTISMRNTGVILKVLPKVHANGSVQLEVDQEISNIVNADKETLTPTIAQRRVHSTVSVNSGQTVLLAGLISERSQQTKSGIPGLREIKFLGDVFGNTSSTKTRSEIIIFIKTQLIRNGVDASAVTEEFRDKLQSMRGGRSVVDGTGVVR